MKPLVEQYFAAFNWDDIEALASFYGDDARLESPEGPFLTVGREGIKEHYNQFFAMIPDVQDHVKNMVIGEDKVAVEFVSTGTAPGAGDQTVKFEFKIASIFEFKNGKIIRDATYYDNAVTQ